MLFATPILTSALLVFAEDACASKTNADDKIACYAKEKQKKESEYQSASKQLTQLLSQKDAISAKISNLSTQLNVTASQIQELVDQINQVQTELNKINTNLTDRNTKLSDKITLRNRVLRNYAKRATVSELELFLAGEGAMSGLQLGVMANTYNQAATEEVIKIIGGLNSEIKNFEKDKQEAEGLKNELETARTKLANIKADLATKQNQAQGDLTTVTTQAKSTQNKLANLQQQIASLDAKQQAILNEKNGGDNGSVGDFESPGSSTPKAPFTPAFAAFSYGAYTHYNGMSQYGAKGRADKGQSYKDILKFYYKTDTTKKSDFPKTISVQGYRTLDFQYYLYGLAEMPTNWPIEALKAQAIAGRTYANRSNKPICTTQSCQVFSKSKAESTKNGGYPNWKKAVDDTKGEILSGTTTAQYSSTTGGYINNVGWDDNGKWPQDAYEKLAGSPWFYKAWYTKNYSTTDSCGRGHPWLSSKELADILNSWVVWDKGTKDDEAHITPITTNCWGGSPYSIDKMAELADKYGDKYASVAAVDVTVGNNGQTTKVTITTDKGTVSIDGATFRTVYNLRAPGYVSIKSRLFDLESR